jgi:hypothetical protein
MYGIENNEKGINGNVGSGCDGTIGPLETGLSPGFFLK